MLTYSDVVTYFGSAANAARALKVSPASLSAWKRREHVPIKTACWIEVCTGGNLSARNGLVSPRSSDGEAEVEG